ncbi:transposase [Leucothrix arctica]|nr:transposase [Leucothrix arctica]
MQLNSNHELYQLSETVDWPYLELEMDKLFHVSDASKCRLMAGLLYLKIMTGLSSNEIASKWLECPYWRYFCGVAPTELSDGLPFAPVVLDIWEREMSGAGNDRLIFAMLKASLVKAAGTGK